MCQFPSFYPLIVYLTMIIIYLDIIRTWGKQNGVKSLSNICEIWLSIKKLCTIWFSMDQNVATWYNLM
jgi:hypothetical protein